MTKGILEMSKFIFLWLVQYISCYMIFPIEQLNFILFFTNVYFYTLASKCCCASVAQAAFRQHPFLVADLPQQPDIGDLYRYIFA